MESTNRKRGRPRKNGTKDETWWLRTAFALSVYSQKRSQELKRESAIAETVADVAKDRPDLRVCSTELKRILHLFQPAGPEPVINFERVPQKEQRDSLSRLREIAELFREDLKRFKKPFPEFLWNENLGVIRLRAGARPKYDPNFGK